MLSAGRVSGDNPKKMILKSQKHVFWQALIVALIFFNLGIFFGYMLERNRIQKIDAFYAESELNFLDIKAMSDTLDLGVSCEVAIQSNLNFADKIYEEAKILQDYEEAARLSEALILRHKKYDLLRAQLWINSITLRKKCSGTFHNVVYLYQYANGEPELDIKQEQEVLSRLLSDIKEKYGNKILLLPLSGDSDSQAIIMLSKNYNITSLPTILIDETHKIESTEQAKDIEKYLN